MFGTDSVHCTPRTMTDRGVYWSSRVSALLPANGPGLLRQRTGFSGPTMLLG